MRVSQPCKITYHIPKLIVLWSIQVYAIVLEFGPGESSDRADWYSSLLCRGS